MKITLDELTKILELVIREQVLAIEEAKIGTLQTILDYTPKDVTETFVNDLYEKLDFDYIESIEIIGGKDEI